MRVIGIDASLRSTGIGVVESQGSRLRLVEFSTVHNPASRCHSECLRLIFRELAAVLDRCKPQAADLGGEHIGIARLAAQEMVDARFRQAEAIKRCRVDIADAGLPCCRHGGLRFLFGEGAEEIAERRRAKAKLGE